MNNNNLKCEDLQAVVFTPSAGLGDSANALSAAFLYTIRAGLMFFIDWQPWDWETGFAGPGFEVGFKKSMKNGRLCEKTVDFERTKKNGEKQTIQRSNIIRLQGHITAQHILAKIPKLNEDINFNAVRKIFINSYNVSIVICYILVYS